MRFDTDLFFQIGLSPKEVHVHQIVQMFCFIWLLDMQNTTFALFQ